MPLNFIHSSHCNCAIHEASSSYSDHAYAYPLLYILPIEKSKSKSRPSKTYDPGRPLLIFVMLIVLHLCQLPDPEPLHLKRARKNARVRALSRLSSLVNYDDLFPVCLFNFTPTHGHSRPHHRCLRSLRSTNYRSLSLIANVVYLVLVLWVES